MEGGSSWAQHEPAALTLRAGTSRQQPAGSPPSSSRTGEPSCSASTSATRLYLGAETFMAVAYTAVSQLGLLSQQYPPPLLPKPGKDNVRLQKLLKRTAKKKASTQASQSAAPFRSSLSPVNEASPDLEHSDHSTPPRTPEASSIYYGVQQPPRYTIRAPYQHVASPYPQRASFGRGARFSPQTVAMPSYSYSQHVTVVSSYSASGHLSGVLPVQGPVAQTPVAKTSRPAFSVPEATVPATVTKAVFAETHTVLRPAAAVVAPQQKSKSPGQIPSRGGQTVTRPLTVLTQFVKPKSPRPTFKATEPSRSPKPMFDVPQIRLYTASTSYYEASRTPPVYDTAGLTSIGTTLPQIKISSETEHDLNAENEFQKGPTLLVLTEPQRKTPTLEIKRGPTPTSEIQRTTPTSETRRTPTSEIQRTTLASETRRTPTSEMKRATPTAEMKRTPTSEIQRTTPTSETRRTPTIEMKRATPTAEIKRATPTSETRRTPTSELKRATPTAEIRVKTPTHEFQASRTTLGRPKTPAYHVTRATTPVFEISKPNPLLFAVSPITVESERSKTKSEMILNGEILSHMTPAAKPIQQSLTKSKSEPDLTKDKISAAAADSVKPQTITSEPAAPAVTSYDFQKPKTPTYEASRLMTTSPGYKRPKTPTGVSPVAFQRPKTPTQVAQKSFYRGLTPAEYAAYGGIKTYTPAFGILPLKTPTQEEVQVTKEESAERETLRQELAVKETSKAELPEIKEKPNDLGVEKASTTPSIPIIVVSQASETRGSTLRQDTRMTSSHVTAKEETPKAKSPTAEVKTPESQKAEVPPREVAKPKTKLAETKQAPPQGPDHDPLKAVRKLLGKDKVRAAEQKAGTETKTDFSEGKEAVKPVATTETKTEDSKPKATVPALPAKAPAEEPAGNEDKGKDAPEKTEADESRPVAEPLLKVTQKPKGMKSKMSGWSRLKKHMVVEQEEPKFPDSKNGSEREATGQEAKTTDEKGVDKPDAQDRNQTKDTPKATKMWDAVLFQMFSTKENIMHQIELNKNEDQKREEITDEVTEIPSFAYRLPVLLFSPKFDAKKLKEAASRPATKISTVFEMGLIGRKAKDEEPKDFNRTAKGFTTS
ncbi:hypothetical protein Q5P01_013006 [Channa striata]|uniref:Proline rich 33 n=1 Tax=Channa striata TaxID=64152 RepID=A0AA88MT06_CHASR|nr:hypothetical protein Q5P01_013006 [Channa striata]